MDVIRASLLLWSLLSLTLANLKIAIVAEAKLWKVAFGRQMNSHYSTLLVEILGQIDDIHNRLSRPIKDLDNVRTAMGALKEIRENEIRIDRLLGPVEVRHNRNSTHMHMKNGHKRFYLFFRNALTLSKMF